MTERERESKQIEANKIDRADTLVKIKKSSQRKKERKKYLPSQKKISS